MDSQHPKSIALKTVVWLTGALLFFVGISGLGKMLLSLETLTGPKTLFCLFFMIWGVALLRMVQWARWLVSASLLLMAIILPVGIINPFMASDLIAAGKEVPSLLEISLKVFPLVALLLWWVHILEKHKKAFRKSLF